MAIKARHHGVRLRPHVKTHKCAEAARYQVEGHFGGITVSTLAEAEFFAQQGFTDITYAVPISQGKVARACALAQSIFNFTRSSITPISFSTWRRRDA